MKIKIDEFRMNRAEQVEAPLDFATLCALLAAHQAATPTARLARDASGAADQPDRTNPAVAVLLANSGAEAPGNGAAGSFHAAAAARVSGRVR